MSSSPVRAIIFDLGMVLIRFDFNRAIQQLAPRCLIPIQEIESRFWSTGAVSRYEIGDLSSHDFAEIVSKAIEFQGSTDELLNAWSDIFSPNQPMIDRLKRWKETGFPVYLLSNTCESHIDFVIPRYGFFSWMDGCVYSHVEKCAKPNPKIYLRLLQRYELDPLTTLFIDDRIENIEGARTLGIQAIHYVDETSFISQLPQFNLTA